jgi:hypothetical protein
MALIDTQGTCWCILYDAGFYYLGVTKATVKYGIPLSYNSILAGCLVQECAHKQISSLSLSYNKHKWD